MDFKPLYYADRLRVVNPSGNVGVVTLWSRVDAVYEVLSGRGVDFSPETSKVAVIANLYGNGLPHMLRNMLYNPQINTLIVLGKNLSGSREWLINFFEHGLEEVEFLGTKSFQIRGTNRIVDEEIKPEYFGRKPIFGVFGEISDPKTQEGVLEFLKEVPSPSDSFERRDPPPIPEPALTRFPTNALMQLIGRPSPTEAWKELVFRLYRFGHRNKVAKSSGLEERIELLNVHVVVENPVEEPEDILEEAGFSLAKFREYQQRILDPVRPQDLGYTYGWLLRTGMEAEAVDSLEIIVERLKRDPESRHAYATLWNNYRHLPSGKGCPCFVTAFFRRFEGKLTLTATFRAHNALDAWLENFYGLMAIQKFVAQGCEMEVGPITVISHSISLDPAGTDKARQIAELKKSDWVLNLALRKLELPLDPNGEFTVTVDREAGEIVVEHSFKGMSLGQYRGKSAEELERRIVRDCSISLVSHALYIGREIARAEEALKSAKSKIE